MSSFAHFSKPKFTARMVAEAIGQELGRKLAFQEPDEDEDTDGNVDVTGRVHVQVGWDYLIVGAWVDEQTLRSWPLRATIPAALEDVREALLEFPEGAS